MKTDDTFLVRDRDNDFFLSFIILKGIANETADDQ